MSIEATTWALNVPVGGNAKVVLLGLANHAHPDGTESYPALDTLAHYAHCDRSTARRNVRKLAEEGWIVEDGYGPRGQVKYRLPLERGGKTPRVAPAPEGGGKTAPGGVAPAPPEPSIEPSMNRPVGESAHARPKINGKPTNPDTWQRTLHALAEFNRQAGKRMLPTTGSGEPSEAAKRIYSRLASWPDLSDEQIADVIRRTLSSRWWGSDPPTVGVIFGPKVFEENLSRDGAPASLPAGVTPIRRGEDPEIAKGAAQMRALRIEAARRRGEMQQ